MFNSWERNCTQVGWEGVLLVIVTVMPPLRPDAHSPQKYALEDVIYSFLADLSSHLLLAAPM